MTRDRFVRWKSFCARAQGLLNYRRVARLEALGDAMGTVLRDRLAAYAARHSSAAAVTGVLCIAHAAPWLFGGLLAHVAGIVAAWDMAAHQRFPFLQRWAARGLTAAPPASATASALR